MRVIRVWLPVLLLLATSASADSGREEEARILAAWNEAGPAERIWMRGELDRIERARAYVEARCVLVTFDERVAFLDLRDGHGGELQVGEPSLQPVEQLLVT